MNNIFLTMLPFIYRILPIPGWLANKVNTFLCIDFKGIRVPVISHCRFGIKVIIDNPLDLIQRQLYFQGYFEYKETKLFEKHIRPGMTYLDVGANIGWHTLVAARLLGPNGTALAFEPVLKTYSHLEKNIQLNKLNNVKLFNCALSNANGIFPIYPVSLNNDGGNSLFSFQDGLEPIESISAKIGSEILMSAGIKKIDFCKIDVEGAEINVLEGLDSFFKEKRIQTLMIELNEEALYRAGSSGGELVSKLRGYGYNIMDIRADSNVDDSNLPLNTNILCTY